MAAVDLGSPEFVAELRHEELEGLRAGTLASVHSWELVTAVDGPGTRMTLFLDGCPLRCQYCQNPDTWRLHDGLITPIGILMDRVRRYRGLFHATGGGLTISGGEPLMQPAFVERMFKECREEGIHTALDTSGFLGSQPRSRAPRSARSREFPRASPRALRDAVPRRIRATPNR